MRVKIGDVWYSDEDLPICIELSQDDKFNIANMKLGATKYASFPDDYFGGDSQMAFDWIGDKKDMRQ